MDAESCMRRRTLLAAIPMLALPGACAAPVVDAVRGTPAETMAARGFAAVLGPFGGRPGGAAVAVGGGLMLTNAHVAGREGRRLRLQRADGVAETEAEVLRVSRRMDLAVLRAAEGFELPVPPLAPPPEAGDPVWALGPAQSGRAVARGRVAAPSVAYAGTGEGFTARLGALMGFSGGPVVDRAGRLAGLTTAMVSGGAAGAMAALVGADLAGLLGGEGRIVFVLGAEAAMEEAGRLLRT
jgi:S1-C subfamily serine protease